MNSRSCLRLQRWWPITSNGTHTHSPSGIRLAPIGVQDEREREREREMGGVKNPVIESVRWKHAPISDIIYERTTSLSLSLSHSSLHPTLSLSHTFSNSLSPSHSVSSQFEPLEASSFILLSEIFEFFCLIELMPDSTSSSLSSLLLLLSS